MKFTAIAQSFAAFAIMSVNADKNSIRKLSMAKQAGNLNIGNFLQSKPADPNCVNGNWYCTCRDGTECYETQECVDRGASGSCAYREPNDNRAGDRMSCRNGDSCIDMNTACEDGSSCKIRDNSAPKDDDDNIDECYELGEAAAQEIAYDYCPINVAYDYSNPNYPSSCRNVAYGACRGAIYDNVIDNGCSISTSKLNNLQNKCEDQVDSMIDYEVLKQD
eukprot:scaffold16384_cov76-Cyclotella_meneghiniana.AAC.2